MNLFLWKPHQCHLTVCSALQIVADNFGFFSRISHVVNCYTWNENHNQQFIIHLIKINLSISCYIYTVVFMCQTSRYKILWFILTSVFCFNQHSPFRSIHFLFAITEARINMLMHVIISFNSFSVWNKVCKEKAKLNTSVQWLCLVFCSVKIRKILLQGCYLEESPCSLPALAQNIQKHCQ